MICLFCYKSLSRKVPVNYILLFIFTVAESFTVAYICILSYPMNVLIALILTAIVVVALTVYAFTSKTDFTMMGGIFFILGFVLLGALILGFWIRNEIYSIVVSSFCVILFGLYLIYDTQLIVGNKQHALSYDDYILGAMSLYIDIITIFLHILSILQNSS